MTTLTLTQRQVTILGIALTNLYDKIYKSGEGQQMKQEIMELSQIVQSYAMEKQSE